MQDKTKTKKDIILGFLKGFSLLLTYELVEELIEELIAWSITTVIAKALSFLIVVLLTQVVKISAKTLAKAITIVLKPVVKRITFRAGNDKINIFVRRTKKMDNNKFAEIIKAQKEKQAKAVEVVEQAKEIVPAEIVKKVNGFVLLIQRLIAYLKRNIKSNTATITNILSSFASGSVVGGGLYLGGIEIPQWAYLVIGGAVTIVMFIITELGVKGAGFETQEQYEKRVALEKETKNILSLQKQEKRDKIKEEKIANAEAKKLQAIIDAENKANEKIAKESEIALKLEQEKQAKEQAKAKALENAHKYQNAVANGYKGTLAQWLSENK